MRISLFIGRGKAVYKISHAMWVLHSMALNSCSIFGAKTQENTVHPPHTHCALISLLSQYRFLSLKGYFLLCIPAYPLNWHSETMRRSKVCQSYLKSMGFQWRKLKISLLLSVCSLDYLWLGRNLRSVTFPVWYIPYPCRRQSPTEFKSAEHATP